MGLNLNNLADSLSSSAGKSDSTGQTGTSLVSTTVKDNLVAVDGYGKSVSAVLTNMKNGVLDSLSKTKDYLFNTNIADLGSLNDLLKEATAVKNEATSNIQQISNFVGQSVSTVNGIETSVINQANNTINTLNQSVNNTFSDIDGTTQVLSNGASVLSANNFISSINTLLSNAELSFTSLKDRLSETALKASILGYATQLGLSNVVTTVYQSDSTSTTLTSALGSSLESAFNAGNLTMINTLITNLGATYVITTLPNAVTLLLQNYTFDSTITVDQYPTQAAALISTLTTLSPTWDKSSGTNLEDQLSVFVGISSKAALVLKTLPEYSRPIAVAAHYQDTDVLSLAKTQYTTLVFS